MHVPAGSDSDKAGTLIVVMYISIQQLFRSQSKNMETQTVSYNGHCNSHN